jgi:beta-glucosidase
MNAFNPQWQFGHGMSYTTFEYTQLALPSDTLNLNDTLTVSFTVKNTGDRAGKEVAQVYCADRFADITPSVKRLRAFDKFELQAGESQQMTLKIPAQSLQYIGKSLTPTLENGWFDISIANLRDSIYVKTN